MVGSEILLVVLLAAVAWFVWESLRAREAANRAMRTACEARGWQLLDDTVAQRSLTLVRDEDGRATLRRVFDFAYTGTGFDRRCGHLVMLGTRIESLDLTELLHP